MEEENNMLNSKVVYKNEINPNMKDAWVIFFHGFGGSSETWNKQIDEFKKVYNLLLIDFHEGGEVSENLTVDKLCHQIFDIITKNEIEKVHIISVSSGSLIALAFAARYPNKVHSMVMGGGIITFNVRTRFLIFMARRLQNIVPYMSLYRFFAYAIMPGKNHVISRKIFSREAKKLGHIEFCRWVNFIPLLKKNKAYIRMINNSSKRIAILYIMGDEDHLFKQSIIKDVQGLRYGNVVIIPKCGHVCSIENPELFNKISLEFFRCSD